MNRDVRYYPLDLYTSDARMSCYVMFSRQVGVRPHWHDCYEFVLVQAGSGVHCTESERAPISAGTLFLVSPGEVHWYENCSNLLLANILFTPESLDFLRCDDLEQVFKGEFFTAVEGKRPYPVLQSAQLEMADKILERIKMEQIRRLPGHITILRNLFQELIVFLCRSFSSQNSNSVETIDLLGKMMRFMAQNFQKDIQRKDIFRFAGCSIRNGNRIFEEYLGSSPMRELQKIRIQHAELLLKTSMLAISEIAMECGFRDSNYFATVFHKLHGLPPSAYRARNHS